MRWRRRWNGAREVTYTGMIKVEWQNENEEMVFSYAPKKKRSREFRIDFSAISNNLGYRDTQMGDKVGKIKKTRSLETFFALAKNKL